ncbi:hypothetical protein [Brachyspira sp. SAP_772]|uniref:hypothetical protein n=1 Tax=Brachyspira sp. SAP_772 TaxID=2608385 RepID=UPI0012F49B4E|nr:hypothetical protein [Brachyspira sp. SAP_772]
MYKFLLIIIFIFANALYSKDVFNEFVSLYHMDGKNARLIGNFVDTDSKKDTSVVSDFELITGRDYKLVYLKNSKSLFLANTQGFFVMGRNQVSALKISGNYVITGAANMSDIMSVNFINDYKIESVNADNSVSLIKNSKNVPYAKALLKKEGKDYVIDFFDNTGKAIKRGIYKISSSGGFSKMEFYNLVINTNLSTVCNVDRMLSSDVTSSYFRSENMKALFGLFN